MDQLQQRGIIKREKVVGLNDLESFKAAFGVFNILRGDEKGGGGGRGRGTPSMYVSYLSRTMKITQR